MFYIILDNFILKSNVSNTSVVISNLLLLMCTDADLLCDWICKKKSSIHIVNYLVNMYVYWQTE